MNKEELRKKDSIESGNLNYIQGRQYPFGFRQWLVSVWRVLNSGKEYSRGDEYELAAEGWEPYFLEGLSPGPAVCTDLGLPIKTLDMYKDLVKKQNTLKDMENGKVAKTNLEDFRKVVKGAESALESLLNVPSKDSNTKSIKLKEGSKVLFPELKHCWLAHNNGEFKYQRYLIETGQDLKDFLAHPSFEHCNRVRWGIVRPWSKALEEGRKVVVSDNTLSGFPTYFTNKSLDNFLEIVSKTPGKVKYQIISRSESTGFGEVPYWYDVVGEAYATIGQTKLRISHLTNIENTKYPRSFSYRKL